MKQTTHPAVEKICTITDRYLMKFGKVMIGVYQFPTIAQSDYSRFQDALQTALQRLEMRPSYLWIQDHRANVYHLLLWINGYYRADMNDLHPVLNRLWQRYSPMPYQQTECVLVDSSNAANLRAWFGPLILAIGGVQQTGLPIQSDWHKRSFGSSHLQ